MSNPLVTVIIPSYNHAQYIDKAIDSVLSQSYQNIELIIVDDGSKDNTKEIISCYTDDTHVIAIFKEKNQGQGHSINLALTIARGEYTCFLPSDDWYLPKKVQLQIEKFLSLPESVGIVYGRGERFFEDTGQTVAVDLPMYRGFVLEKFIVEGNFIYPATPMFRTKCFEDLSFDESYRAEGEGIYIKLAMQYQFDYVDEVVAVMREHTYNTGSDIEMMYEDNVRWWNGFFEQENLPDEIIKLKSIPLAKIHRMKGLSLIIQRRKFDAGRSALWCALIENWKLAFDPRVVTGIIISLLPSAFSNGIIDYLVADKYIER
jgi:glycosyltransferase involved in cell wall biosynthesis